MQGDRGTDSSMCIKDLHGKSQNMVSPCRVRLKGAIPAGNEHEQVSEKTSPRLLLPMQAKGSRDSIKRQLRQAFCIRTSMCKGKSGSEGDMGEERSMSSKFHSSGLAGEGEQGQYQVAIETGEASNLSGSLAGLGFRSSEGVSPGRVLRVIHAVVRTVFLAMGTKKAELAHADEVIEKVRTLFTHASICLAGSPLQLAPSAKGGRPHGCVQIWLDCTYEDCWPQGVADLANADEKIIQKVTSTSLVHVSTC